eukprot:TRINITY_DN10712_c0_g3_i1.p1 TRINITY_DN10712_c0_g3~~TRINITY_DN10712_c0_g3_i1.p1  ORF type:complete len:124 (-),score=4.31 TRINITY_DN10712_c0_g3_i1:4-375(-)
MCIRDRYRFCNEGIFASESAMEDKGCLDYLAKQNLNHVPISDQKALIVRMNMNSKFKESYLRIWLWYTLKGLKLAYRLNYLNAPKAAYIGTIIAGNSVVVYIPAPAEENRAIRNQLEDKFKAK